jgi:hypothetical protein
LGQDRLILTRGRDFEWVYRLVDSADQPYDFPPGRLFLEFATAPEVTVWDFVVEGDRASIRVESDVADLIPNRCRWQLVFLPEPEESGGQPVALGSVTIQK